MCIARPPNAAPAAAPTLKMATYRPAQESLPESVTTAADPGPAPMDVVAQARA